MSDERGCYLEAADLLATIQFCMCVSEQGEHRFWHYNSNGLELPCETLAKLGLMSPLPPSGHAFTDKWRPGDQLELQTGKGAPSLDELNARLLFFVQDWFPDVLAKGSDIKERPPWNQHGRSSNVPLMKWALHRAEEYLLARD